MVVIGFLNTSYTVGESDGQVNIQIGVISPGSLQRPVMVQFSTSADSADGKVVQINCACNYNDFERNFSLHTAGSDYSESVIQFTFDSATREVDVSVPIISDSLFELTELFNASLAFTGAPPPRISLAPASAQVTIRDDDGQC